MRVLTLLLASMLLLGCISFGERMSNETGSNDTANDTAPVEGNTTQNLSANDTMNDTNQSIQPEPPKTTERFVAKGFSFEYPLNMVIQQSNSTQSGVFSGTHNIDGKTGEILLVSYFNTSLVYGGNKEAILQANPTKAASDFLVADKKSDPVGGLLTSAYEVGNITTFGLARDAFAAQAPFRIRFGGSNTSYSGHAISIYIPERSMHVKVRIVALDSNLASTMRDDFLLSFRIE